MSRRLVLAVITSAAVVGSVAPSFAQSSNRALPIVFRHDANGTAVGVGDVGVTISPSGRVCPVVSTQDWQCYQVGTR